MHTAIPRANPNSYFLAGVRETVMTTGWDVLQTAELAPGVVYLSLGSQATEAIICFDEERWETKEHHGQHKGYGYLVGVLVPPMEDDVLLRRWAMRVLEPRKLTWHATPKPLEL